MTIEEAIYRLKNTAWLGTDKDREETEQAVDMAVEALSERTGEWRQSRVHEGYVVCNKCGFHWTGNEAKEHFNFCPNCGADMRERIEE